MNPFRNSFPIENREELTGFENYFEKLEECIQNKENTVIQGVMGSGKTSLLKSYFSFSYRKKMALEQKKLIYFADLTKQTDGEAISVYLADTLKNTVKRLLRGQEDQESLLMDFSDYDNMNGISRLSKMIDLLHEEYGYFVVQVMDCFERFTSSPTVTMTHHEVLRSLIEAGSLQCIVATNYDLSQDSLPKGVKGSFYLQKFTNKILIEPWTLDMELQHIKKKMAEKNISFTEEEMRMTYLRTGGIPSIVEMSSHLQYAAKKSGNTSNSSITTETYNQCEPIFDEWCRLLTEPQIKVLKTLAGRIVKNQEYVVYDFTGEQEDILQAVNALKGRGILRRYSYIDNYGNLRNGQDMEVMFNSLLFQLFCKKGKVEAAASKNPLLEEQGEKETPQTIIYDQRTIYESGAQDNRRTYDNGAQDNTQVLQVENFQITRGFSASDFVNLLGNANGSSEAFANQLVEYLKQSFMPNRMKIPVIRPEDYETIEEYDQQCDIVYNELSQGIVKEIEVDEDADPVDVTAEELLTLDSKYDEIQRREGTRHIRPEVMEKLSERCQFYIKSSIIVEDALSLVGRILADFSPQIVLYGKALELTLRDNFFPLFNKDTQLSEYDFMKHKENASSRDNFKNADKDKSFIGNYQSMIGDKKNYLSQLCTNQGLHVPENSKSWNEWWKKLQSDVNTARQIRNMLHAGDHAPQKSELETMCKKLLGQETDKGVLERTLIGVTLFQSMFPAEITKEVGDSMIGTVQTMLCTERKSNGGMKGKLTEGNYTVNISPRKAKKYRDLIGAAAFEPKGKEYRIQILEYKTQNDQDFFVGEILDEVR